MQYEGDLNKLNQASKFVGISLGVSAIEFKSKINKEVSVFDNHTCVPLEDKVQIKHIQTGGPYIYVTNKRVRRILKRRKKRVDFLLENPEFSLPYKFRNKGPKHQSRSKSAKGRKRKGDGRFAKAKNGKIDFTVTLDDPEFSNRSVDEGSEIIAQEKL
jgi:hypothetical protein